VCKEGWTGKDCSLPTVGNKCSGNGVFQNGKCVCNKGFSLVDCSGKQINLPRLTSDLSAKNTYLNDKYGLDHPVFNISTLGTFHFEVNPDNLVSMLESNFAEHNVTLKRFHNGQIDEADHKCQYKIQQKGQMASMSFQKSFKVVLKNECQPNGWHDVKTLAFAPLSYDPSYARSFMAYEVIRSMDLPIARSSFAVVYMNDVYFGLFWLEEKVSNKFLKSRFPKDEGFLFKCPSTSGNYVTCPSGSPKDSGIGWCAVDSGSEKKATKHFCKFQEALVKCNTEKNNTDIAALINLETVVRSVATDAALLNSDGIGMNRNNFYLHSNSDGTNFEILMHDFDYSEGFKAWLAYSEDPYYSLSRYNYGIPYGLGACWDTTKEMYTKELQRLIDGPFNPNGKIGELTNGVYELLSPAAAWDANTWRGDIQFFIQGWNGDVVHTLNNFMTANYMGLNNFFKNRHVTLKKYIEENSNSAQKIAIE